MKKVILIPNEKRDNGLEFFKYVAKKFSKECLVYVEDIYNDIEGASPLTKEELLECGADIVISLGGDGTLLSAVEKMLGTDIPILGINLGHLGFLAELEKSMFDEYLERIIKGDYNIEKRMMIETRIIRDNKVHSVFHSLNDVVIARGGLSRILHAKLKVDGFELDNFVADGVCISTPTGSTGYSLSVGGPIISPEVCAILVTAISPHNMSTRPVVIPSDKIMSVTVENCDECRAYISSDGRNGGSLVCGDLIEIRKSEHETKLVKLENLGFYETVRRKLNQRGRE